LTTAKQGGTRGFSIIDWLGRGGKERRTTGKGEGGGGALACGEENGAKKNNKAKVQR